MLTISAPKQRKHLNALVNAITRNIKALTILSNNILQSFQGIELSRFDLQFISRAGRICTPSLISLFIYIEDRGASTAVRKLNEIIQNKH